LLVEDTMNISKNGLLAFISSHGGVPGFRSLLLGFIILLMFGPGPVYGQLDSILGKLKGGNRADLGEAKIGSGLKEALQVGTENAVKSTGRPDGYFANEAIKILLPPKLKAMERVLRIMGRGPEVDQFVLSMNRAAEQAAPLAKPIFLDALRQMTFEDARKILSGGDTAATDYFKLKTSDKLAKAFKPAVDEAMANTGVERQFNKLMGSATALPFGEPQALDINHYVVTKALDGLFLVLSQEERKIRNNPAARVTPLLKQVFGGLRG
jgi:hypothetical protein